MSKEILYADLIHPNDLRQVMSEVSENVNSSSNSFKHEPYRLLTKSGKIIWVLDETTTRKEEDGTITHFEGTIHDITDIYERHLKSVKDFELKKSESLRFKLFANTAFEAIIISEKGFCIEQNHAAKVMFGYSDEEAIGMHATDIISEECHDRVLQSIKTKSTSSYDVVAKRKDGSTFYAEIQGRSLYENGDSIRITAIRDITERKIAEFKAIEQKQELAKANTYLESKTKFLQTVNEFARNIEKVTSVDDIVWGIVENVIDKFEFEDCEIFLFDNDKKNLVQSASYRENQDKSREIIDPMIIPLGSGIVGTTAQNGVLTVVADTSKDARYIPTDRVCLSELTIPIIADGVVLGVIDSEHPKANFFTYDYVEHLTTIANIAASRLKSAIAEKALKQSELRHRLYLKVPMMPF
jgi:PAS domain S-box-containing protein